MSTTKQSEKTNQLSRIFGATFNYGLGQVLPQLINFLLLPLYTVYLAPKDYGIIEIASMVATVLVILMRFGVPGAISRFYFDYDEEPELSNYITTISRFIFFTSLIVGIAGLTVLISGAHIVFPEVPIIIFIILLADAFLIGQPEIQKRLLQVREQSGYMARLNITFSIADILLTLLFVIWFKLGAVGILLAQLVCDAIFFIQAKFYLRPNLHGKFNKEMARVSFIYALGILPSHLIGALGSFATRYILAFFGSLDALGLLSMANRFTIPLNVIVSAFGNAFYPVYFSIRKDSSPENIDKLQKLTKQIWIFTVFIGLSAALLGPIAILIMTNVRFHSASPIMPYLVIGFVANVLYVITGQEIFYAKKTWIISLIAIFCVLSSLIVTLLTVNKYGAIGVAIASSTYFVVAAMITTAIASKISPVFYEWKFLVKITLIGLALFIAASFFNSQALIIRITVSSLAIILFPLILIKDETVNNILASAISMLKRTS